MRVQPADGKSLGPAAQLQPELAGLVPRHRLYGLGAHHNGAVHLPELVSFELGQQFAQRRADQSGPMASAARAALM